MALCFPEPTMSTLPEFVGTIHIFFGPYRGNPIALYLRKEGESCHISPTSYPWNRFVGIGETVNKAAANFDAKWKEGNLAPEMYSGPHWEGGIKPEKPKPPPKPAAPPQPATTEPAKAETTDATPLKTEAASAGEVKTGTPSTAAPANSQGNSIEPPQANPMSLNPTQTPAPQGETPPGPYSAPIPSSDSPPVPPISGSDPSPQKPTD